MSDELRKLPAVNSLLDQAEAAGLLEEVPRPVVTNAVREILEEARTRGGAEPKGGWLAAVRERASRWRSPSLISVINGTGVVLHTNLGRAPLAGAARAAMAAISGYSSLEFDLREGERGSRQDHVRHLLTLLTGAEDALVVNNAASALLLLLNSLADGRDTLVSRGELVEIGGSFRIPDILRKSGSSLLEVGTTNRTRLRDYERAVSPRTGAVLKVHRSNFELRGFVTESTVEELSRRFRPLNVPVLHDVGSGLLLDLSEFGLEGEPLVPACTPQADVTIFSGDKLLGGPQAGILVGSTEAIGLAAQNPLTRALRPDKTILAGLEATLALYLDRDTALREIPTLAMLTARREQIRDRAQRLSDLVEKAEVVEGESSVGGGAFPETTLPSWLVSVPTPEPSRLARRLRDNDPPVVPRVESEALLFDARTLADDELDAVARAVGAALHERSRQ